MKESTMMLLLVTVVCMLLGVFTSNKTFVMLGFLVGFVIILDVTGKGKSLVKGGFGLNKITSIFSKVPKTARSFGGIAIILTLLAGIGYFTSGLGNGGSNLFSGILANSGIVIGLCVAVLVILLVVKIVKTIKQKNVGDRTYDGRGFRRGFDRGFGGGFRGNTGQSREEMRLERERLKFERSQMKMEASRIKQENRQANREMWEMNKDANKFKAKVAIGIVGSILAVILVFFTVKGAVSLVSGMSLTTVIIAIACIAGIAFLVAKIKKGTKSFADILGTTYSEDHVFDEDLETPDDPLDTEQSEESETSEESISNETKDTDSNECTESVEPTDTTTTQTASNQEKTATRVNRRRTTAERSPVKPIDVKESERILNNAANSADIKPVITQVDTTDTAHRGDPHTNRRHSRIQSTQVRQPQSTSTSQNQSRQSQTRRKPTETQAERIFREQQGKPSALMQDLFNEVNNTYDVDKDVQEMIASGKYKRRPNK